MISVYLCFFFYSYRKKATDADHLLAYDFTHSICSFHEDQAAQLYND